MFNLVEKFKKNINNILYKDRFNLIEIDNLIDENFARNAKLKYLPVNNNSNLLSNVKKICK
tara:strand:+ start:68 stop:250 length:183 start_codon:yes stop_codon:yes gene_type:complete